MSCECFWSLNGPNRSMAVQVQAGDGFSLSTGNFPIICSLGLLSSFLHIKQLYLIELTILSSLTIQNLVGILLGCGENAKVSSSMDMFSI